MPSLNNFGWPSTIDTVWISSNTMSAHQLCTYAIRPNRFMRGCNIFHTMYAIAYGTYFVRVLFIDVLCLQCAFRCAKNVDFSRCNALDFRSLRSLIAIKWCELVVGKWMNFSFYADLTVYGEMENTNETKWNEMKERLQITGNGCV